MADPRHQTAHFEKLVHELREGLRSVLVALREVADHALLQVDLELVAVLDRLARLGRLHDREAHVDGVGEDYARERAGDDERNAGAPNGARRVPTRRPPAEVRAT